MAGKDFGGRMSVRLASGALIALRGTFSNMPARQSTERITNQDGSTDRIATPVSPTADINFKDDGLDLQAIMEAPRQNMTINEEFTGVTHYFFNAFFAGNPQTNRVNGEVTGVQIVAEDYRKTGA